MAISRIGTVSCGTADDWPGFPSHQAGDLLLVWKYHDGTSTPEAGVPPSPWNTISAAGNSSSNSILGWKLAASGSETLDPGDWGLGAGTTEGLIAHVYRGVDQADPIGGSSANGASSNTVTYSAITMQTSDGTSWIVAFGGHRATDNAIDTPPGTLTLREDLANASIVMASFDSNGGLSAWAGDSVSTGGTASGWRTNVVEIRAAAGGADPAEGSGTISGVAVATATGARESAGSGSSAAVGVLTAAGARASEGSGSIVGVGVLTATGEAPDDVPKGSGTISGVAVLTAEGARESAGSGAVTAVGLLTAEGYRVSEGAGAVEGIGVLVGVGAGGEAAPIVIGGVKKKPQARFLRRAPKLPWEVDDEPEQIRVAPPRKKRIRLPVAEKLQEIASPIPIQTIREISAPVITIPELGKAVLPVEDEDEDWLWLI